MARWTLFPTDDTTRAMQNSGLNDSRVDVEAPDDLVLTETWQSIGGGFEFRSADCGAGCRCAGEVRSVANLSA